MFNMFKHEDSVIFDPIWCSVIGSDISKSTGAPKKRFLEEYERDLCYRRCAKKLIDEDLIYGVTNANYAKRADAMKITAVIYQLMYGDKEADYAKLLSLFGKEYASTADVVSGLYRRMADPTAKLPFKYIKDTWGSDLGNVAVFAIYLLASPESYLPQNRKSFERLSEVFSQINSTRKNTSPMSDQQKVLMKYGISIQKNFSDFETAAMQGSRTRTIPVENEDGTCTQDTIFSYSDYGVHCHSELLSGLAMLDAGVSNCSNYDKTITKQKFLDAQKAVAKSLNFTKEMDGKVKFGDKVWPSEHILLMAPTGLAAKRMAESTGMNSATIHKACGLVPADNPSGFKAQGECRICGFVGIDEMSMVGEHLFAFAVDAVLNSPSTRIVLLGDTDQLAPVSRGDVLRDLIECGVIKTVRLDVNYRQGSTSTITDASIKIRENRAYSGMTRNLRFDDEFNFISVTDPDEKTEADKIMKTIVEEYRKGVAQYGMQGTIVLTPTHYDKGTPTGYLCKNRVNVEIQAAVNPKTDGKPFYEVNHQTFMAGDRVIQRKNTEAVINGDLGTVQEILKDDDGVRVCILFDSKNEVLTYDSNDMKNVELAYAITVHSSQGCEFPCCIFPVSSSYGPMLTKPLYYTGITRAKKKLVMIGDEEALKKAVRTTRTQGRKSLLGPRIIKRLRNM